jgi:hypothetical protein
VGLRGGEDDPASPDVQSGEIVSLSWSKKPFRAEKGVAHELGPAQEPTAVSAEVVIAAVARARRWVDQLTAGDNLTEITKRERKGERQIRLLLPLAFLTPASVRGLVEGKMTAKRVADLAKRVPLVW